jgi:hypothetical protein
MTRFKAEVTGPTAPKMGLTHEPPEAFSDTPKVLMNVVHGILRGKTRNK